MGSPWIYAPRLELTRDTFLPLKVLQDHRLNPPEKSDLVQAMLTGRDKETGLCLSDQNIKYNVR